MVIEAIGRRLRLAVVGGGPGSIIGEVHRTGARLDGYYDIVASTLSSDPERSRRYGRAIGVSEERAYPSWRELIESEAKRKDRVDVIAVMTPNDSHYKICTLALDFGFHVVCDKPLTTDLTSAVSLADKVKATGLEFCLTHCYTGYPMVRQARAMIRAGAIGSMWVTNAASGAEHGLCFRIFGETGGLEWYQEEPNRLVHRKRDGLEEIITRRQDLLVSEDARRVTRFQIGHPEGYIEAFANLYSDFARAVVARMRGKPPDQIDRPFPTVEDSVKGLAFVQAPTQTSALRAWKSVEVPSI